MNDQVRKYLLDVQIAVNNIYQFLGEKRDFKVYAANLMLKQAVERNLEIIGEAVNHALKIMPDMQITNSRKIVDLRNKLIHAYDNIDDAVVWAIIVRHLPLLHEEVKKLLETE